MTTLEQSVRGEKTYIEYSSCPKLRRHHHHQQWMSKRLRRSIVSIQDETAQADIFLAKFLATDRQMATLKKELSMRCLLLEFNATVKWFFKLRQLHSFFFHFKSLIKVD
jgi:hypothetical protein